MTDIYIQIKLPISFSQIYLNRQITDLNFGSGLMLHVEISAYYLKRQSKFESYIVLKIHKVILDNQVKLSLVLSSKIYLNVYNFVNCFIT